MKASLPLSSGMTGPAPGLSSSQFALLMLTMQTFQARSGPSRQSQGLPGEVGAFRARSGPSGRGRGLPGKAGASRVLMRMCFVSPLQELHTWAVCAARRGNAYLPKTTVSTWPSPSPTSWATSKYPTVPCLFRLSLDTRFCT